MADRQNAPTEGRVLKRVIQGLAAAVALYTIWNSFEYMVMFAERRLGLDHQSAIELGGVIELALAFLALAAFYEATKGRSYRWLMGPTWGLAVLSGALVAADQFSDHGLLAAISRFAVPLIGVGLAHVALLLQHNDFVDESGLNFRAMRDKIRAQLAERHKDRLVITLITAAARTRDFERASQERARAGIHDPARKAEKRARSLAKLVTAETTAKIAASREMDADELRAKLRDWSETDAVWEDERSAIFLRGELPPVSADQHAERAGEPEPARPQITPSEPVLAIENERAPRAIEQARPAQHEPENEHAPLVSEPSEQVAESVERAAEQPERASEQENARSEIASSEPVLAIENERAAYASEQAPTERASAPSEPRPLWEVEGRPRTTLEPLTAEEVEQIEMMREAKVIKTEEIAARFGFKDRNAMYRALNKAHNGGVNTPGYGTPQAPEQATMEPFDYTTAYAAAAPASQRNDY